MQAKRRLWWPLLKTLVGLAVVFFIARRFVRDLDQPELYQEPITFGWLVAAGLLYLGGLGMACTFWGWLLAHLGPRPTVLPLVRAYFVGQLGKYVPGKALALVLRAALARRAGVSPGLAGLSAFYEVLTTMAAGVLLAAVLYLTQTNTVSEHHWGEAWSALVRLQAPPQGLSSTALLVVALILLGLISWPIVPPIFNRLAHRLSLPFRDPSRALPRFRWSHLLVGLGLAGIGWLLMGAALACTLHAVPGAGLSPSWWTIIDLTAIVAIAYVAGFIVLIAPGGLGVRELFLAWLLTPRLAVEHDLPRELAQGKVVLVVLLLRLSWTVAEVLLAAVLFPMRERGS